MERADPNKLRKRWLDKDLTLLKYIDDFNAVEKVSKNGAVRGYSQGKPTAEVRALKSKILTGR